MKIGDVVMLKSGGPDMVVRKVTNANGGNFVECDWFDKAGQLHFGDFKEIMRTCTRRRKMGSKREEHFDDMVAENVDETVNLPVSDCGCFTAGIINEGSFVPPFGEKALPMYGVIIWYENRDLAEIAMRAVFEDAKI